ncbi:MAG: hypothetical protein M0R49_11695 [Limnochordia bacterium]|nr:hypothetical protein [Limnochordia bacterium]
MYDFTEDAMEEALHAIASMISRSEKAGEKFAQGTSQHTLQKNRFRALNIASLLISKELGGSNAGDYYIEEDLEKALAPINSLISNLDSRNL